MMKAHVTNMLSNSTRREMKLHPARADEKWFVKMGKNKSKPLGLLEGGLIFIEVETSSQRRFDNVDEGRLTGPVTGPVTGL